MWLVGRIIEHGSEGIFSISSFFFLLFNSNLPWHGCSLRYAIQCWLATPNKTTSKSTQDHLFAFIERMNMHISVWYRRRGSTPLDSFQIAVVVDIVCVFVNVGGWGRCFDIMFFFFFRHKQWHTFRRKITNGFLRALQSFLGLDVLFVISVSGHLLQMRYNTFLDENHANEWLLVNFVEKSLTLFSDGRSYGFGWPSSSINACVHRLRSRISRPERHWLERFLCHKIFMCASHRLASASPTPLAAILREIIQHYETIYCVFSKKIP